MYAIRSYYAANKRYLAADRKSATDSDHVLLGDSNVNDAFREALPDVADS